ncbi:SRPBCC family protein [Mycolicibacterium wolinskyi]|uniref:SRPBCC family protein n=1 Tax=Mycolicibacterium wolinskyi TaxID=59750 RepID=UPI00082D8668|nr:SRPBCC family protein [Mycolicibacterium wolinskyi]
MFSVGESIEIASTPDAVWSLVGDPAAICVWHPGIQASSFVNGVRYCTLTGGGEVAEQIVEHCDRQRCYVYALLGSQFGIVGYRSRIHVLGVDGGGARMEWTGQFDATEPAHAGLMTESIAATYRDGLNAVRNRLA